MFQLLRKLKLQKKLDPEAGHSKCSTFIQNLIAIIRRLPSPKKVFLQLEHHTDLYCFICETNTRGLFI